MKNAHSLPFNNILAIIPARWESTRFPGKPLALINGIPMVIRVYREAAKVFNHVVIATDDERIRTAAEYFKTSCILTSEDHSTGTSRCAEAVLKFQEFSGRSFSSILNIQGDEPLISQDALALLAESILEEDIDIATLMKHEVRQEEIGNPNRVKVTCDHKGFALYFSRYPIPFVREPGVPDRVVRFYIHIGVYAFKTEILKRLQQLPPGELEQAESLEQLRWLESGYRIACRETDYQGFGIDTPDDLENILRLGLF